jgi:FAD/FMN-containing dehydrogenase
MRANETNLKAETLRPGDDGYDDAAMVFMGAGEPALVVRPGDPDEVAEVLGHAVRNDLAVSVRSGGHSLVGHSTNTGGMVIDLRRMAGIEVVDAERRLVRVGSGATWAEVAAALEPHGWGLTSGDTTSVGVGGLTLGGGMGWMVRRHGLTIDNLRSARVVTADGRLITASADEHPDLFWALRGGGGNFGVVVDFDFEVHETPGVHFGSISYSLDDAAGLLTRWRDAMRAAPDELSSTFALIPRFPGAPALAQVLVCYAGSPGHHVSEADAAIEPLLELGTVVEASITERRYAEILEEPMRPPGIRASARNVLVATLGDDVIAAAVAAHEGQAPTAVAVRSLGGAFGRVAVDATAFAHRDAEAMVQCAVLVPEATPEAEVAAALGPWGAVATLGTGTYVNFQGSATAEDVSAAYPPATLSRLAEVKRAYDPGNVFALNHNIEPVAGASVAV